jgi:hypothetical protein
MDGHVFLSFKHGYNGHILLILFENNSNILEDA